MTNSWPIHSYLNIIPLLMWHIMIYLFSLRDYNPFITGWGGTTLTHRDSTGWVPSWCVYGCAWPRWEPTKPTNFACASLLENIFVNQPLLDILDYLLFEHSDLFLQPFLDIIAQSRAKVWVKLQKAQRAIDLIQDLEGDPSWRPSENVRKRQGFYGILWKMVV